MSMFRQTTAQSPQYQRLPFTHNAVQAFLSSNHQSKPCGKPTQLLLKPQQSLEKLKHNQLSFLKKKPSVEDNNVFKAKAKTIELTPNSRLRAQQLYTKQPNQSPNMQARLTEYSSLQSTSAKRFTHNPTGSMNMTTLQQQLSLLNRKAGDALGQRTPIKTMEHNKSRSVVESKENDFSASNAMSTQESRCLAQACSPIVSESVGSQGRVMCSVHHEKKAKYVNEANGHYHCNKCAVQFARMQINLLELPTTTDQQQYKENEMQQFLDAIDATSHGQLPSLLKSQLGQVKLFYQGQIHQCEQVFRQLQGCLQQSYQKAHCTLSSEMQNQLSSIQNMGQATETSSVEIDTIRQDIQMCWPKIIEGVELGVFRSMMDGYNDRLKLLTTQMNALNGQHIVMMSMPPTDTGNLCSSITESFSLLNSTLPLIPSEYKEGPAQILRTQPTPPKVAPVGSFTPKSRIKTDVEHPTTNFFQYFFHNQEQITESVESCRAVSSNSVHTNPIYVSFENRDIFCQAKQQQQQPPQSQEEIMVLQSYRGSQVVSEDEDEHKCHSTPHSPASGQTKSQYERVTTTQQIKQVTEQQRSKQTFRTLFETQPEEENKVSPTTSDKFKSFLHKVNTNQSKTQQFYQNMWPKTLSPRYESEEEDREVQTVFQSRELGSQKKWHSSAKRGNELSVPSDSSSSSEGKAAIRDPYQKTLFCSPTFKNDDLNVSQSDID